MGDSYINASSVYRRGLSVSGGRFASPGVRSNNCYFTLLYLELIPTVIAIMHEKNEINTDLPVDIKKKKTV